MRHAATVVHVCEPGAYVAIDAGHLTVRRGEVLLARAGLGWIGMLCLHHRSITVSGMALAALLAEGVPVAWFTGGGRLLHRMVPPWGNDVGLRLQQMRLCQNEAASLAVARRLVARKVAVQTGHLAERLRRSGFSSRGLAALRDRCLLSLAAAADLATLRGIEGRLGRLYFRAIARSLPEDLRFTARQRPADGVVNAGLNLLYSQLTWRMDAFVQAQGFDPGLGAMHRHSAASTSAWGRPHLACDLVEELRAPLVDAFWFPVLGRRRWQEDDVVPDAEVGHRFTDTARGELLLAWEQYWRHNEGWQQIAAVVDAWHQDVRGYTCSLTCGESAIRGTG